MDDLQGSKRYWQGRLHWGPMPRFAAEETANTLAGLVFHKLREDIIAGRLLPNEKLHLNNLQERYDAGMSPVREALNQLAADGLVWTEGQKGFRVAPVSLAEYHDVVELRVQFDDMALRASMKHGDADWEARIVSEDHRTARIGQEIVECEDDTRRDVLIEEWEDRHRRFHVAICSACPSPWLLFFCERLYDQMERYRRCFWTYSQRMSEAAEEHGAIRDAVIGRKTELASELLAKHYRHQAVKTAEALRVNGVT